MHSHSINNLSVDCPAEWTTIGGWSYQQDTHILWASILSDLDQSFNIIMKNLHKDWSVPRAHREGNNAQSQDSGALTFFRPAEFFLANRELELPHRLNIRTAIYPQLNLVSKRIDQMCGDLWSGRGKFCDNNKAKCIIRHPTQAQSRVFPSDNCTFCCPKHP